MATPKTLITAIMRLTAEASGHGKAADLAREVLPLLASAADELKWTTRAARRGTGKIEYLVEQTQQGEVLTERRLSGKSQPFRCTKTIYEAIAEVLATADRPLLLDEIVAGVEKLLGIRPAEYHVRLPLRLWLHVAPALITRNRARYDAAHKQVVAEAQFLWQKLATHTDE